MQFNLLTAVLTSCLQFFATWSSERTVVTFAAFSDAAEFGLFTPG